MDFNQLSYQAEYLFYVACREALGVPLAAGSAETMPDDAVATYCMGGEL